MIGTINKVKSNFSSKDGYFLKGDEFEILTIEDFGYVAYHTHGTWDPYYFITRYMDGVHVLIYDIKSFHNNTVKV